MGKIARRKNPRILPFCRAFIKRVFKSLTSPSTISRISAPNCSQLSVAINETNFHSESTFLTIRLPISFCLSILGVMRGTRIHGV